MVTEVWPLFYRVAFNTSLTVLYQYLPGQKAGSTVQDLWRQHSGRKRKISVLREEFPRPC